MKKEPIISIITPYYNAEEYIDDTAKSVLNQTFPYFEWIIIDDGSEEIGKEKLKQIMKKDKRIKVFFTENMGPAQARDFGLRNTSKSTKYIVFLDADDLYRKNFFRMLLLDITDTSKS